MKNLQLILLFFLLVPFASTQVLTPDKTFGDHGFVKSSYPNEAVGTAFKVTPLDDDQGYLVVDVVLDDTSDISDYYTLSRYLPDGQKDLTFANNGTYQFPYNLDIIFDYVVLKDGTIVVAELTNLGDVAIIALDKNGQFLFRKTYNSEGLNYLPRFIANDEHNIYLGGIFNHINSPTDNIDSLYIIKLNNDFTADSTFGNGGQVKFNISADSGLFMIELAVQEGHPILLYGSDEFDQKALVRFNSDGTIDSGFGNNGFAYIHEDLENGFDYAQLFIDSTGNLIVSLLDNEAITTKYTKDGILDTTYGYEGIGIPLINYSEDISTVFSTYHNGSIYFFGVFDKGASSDTIYNPAIIKYGSNGFIDTTFGNKGVFVENTVPIGVYYGGAFDAQNRLIAVGATPKDFDPSDPRDGDLFDQSLVVRYQLKTLATKITRKRTALSSHVYPNPCRDHFLTVQLRLPSSEKTQVVLRDVSGLYETLLLDKQLPEGDITLQLPLPVNLHSGTYLLQIQTENEVFIPQKVEILRD